MTFRRPPDSASGQVLPGAKPHWLGGFISAASVAGSLPLFFLVAPRLEGDPAILGLLIAIAVIADLKPISIYGSSQITVGPILTIAIIILFGAPGVVIAAPIEALVVRGIARGLWDHRIAISAGRFALIDSAGAGVYSLIADVGPSAFDLDVLVGTGAATVTCFGLTACFMVLLAPVRSGVSVAEAWDQNRWVGVHYLAFGVLGLALAMAYVAIGVFGIAAFVMPALMMRIAIKQYVEKTEVNVAKLQKQNQALEQANVEIRRVSDELRVSYDGTLDALVNALDARDQETAGHSQRVSRYMMDIAREMGVKPDSKEWTDMARGSLLHDVGKIGVQDAILLKPGKLTPEEWEKMRLHPEIGYNMLSQIPFLQGAAEIILSHHERWDGNGYPRGLREEEIPLGARIFPVVDTFDAMTVDRPYRKAKSTLDAMNEILRCSATQFDPLVVEAFMDLYEKWRKEVEELREQAVAQVA